MNIWEVSLESANWEVNPWQTVSVATNSMDIEEAVEVARTNFPSAIVTGIKHICFAHLPYPIDPTTK